MGIFDERQFNLFRALQLFEDRWMKELNPQALKSRNELKETQVADRLHKELLRMVEEKFFDDCEPNHANEVEDIDEHQTIDVGSGIFDRNNGTEVDISTIYTGSVGRSTSSVNTSSKRPSDKYLKQRSSATSQDPSVTVRSSTFGSSSTIHSPVASEGLPVTVRSSTFGSASTINSALTERTTSASDEVSRKTISPTIRKTIHHRPKSQSKPKRGILKSTSDRKSTFSDVDDEEVASRKPIRMMSKSTARRIVDKVVSFVKPKSSQSKDSSKRRSPIDNNNRTDNNYDDDDDDEEDDDDDDDDDDDSSDEQLSRRSPSSRRGRRSYRGNSR